MSEETITEEAAQEIVEGMDLEDGAMEEGAHPNAIEISYQDALSTLVEKLFSCKMAIESLTFPEAFLEGREQLLSFTVSSAEGIDSMHKDVEGYMSSGESAKSSLEILVQVLTHLRSICDVIERQFIPLSIGVSCKDTAFGEEYFSDMVDAIQLSKVLDNYLSPVAFALEDIISGDEKDPEEAAEAQLEKDVASTEESPVTAE